ncbi:MAG: amidohydrolase family protein [Ferruginibacter sp.]
MAYIYVLCAIYSKLYKLLRIRKRQTILLLVLLSGFGMTSNAQIPKTIFYDATVVDVQNDKLLKHYQVIVEGNKIISVSPIAKIKLSKEVRVINAKGKYIIPGLWDMHVHVLEEDEGYEWQLPLFLANGIIGFREMWGDRKIIDSLRIEMQKGSMPFFHFIASGHILDGKKVFWKGSLSAGDTMAAFHLVDSLANAKVNFIKIYSFLEPEVFEAISKKCKERKVQFVGHVPHRVWLTRASEAGMASMEHLYGFLIEACSFPDSAMKMKKINADNFETGMEPKLRIEKARSSEKFMLDNFSENRMRAIAMLLKKNNTYIVPTVVTNRGGYFSNDTSFTNDIRLKYLSPEARDEWKEETENDIKKNTSQDWQNKRKRYDIEKIIIKILWQEKVPILAGTDSYNPYAFPGFSLHDEMALFVEFGMTPIDALRTATLNPVKYLKMTDTLGTIEAGKRADMIILNGNPLTDIRNTKNIFSVMINGKLFTSGELDKMKETVAKKNRY